MTLSQVQCKILHGGKDMLYIIRHGKTDWNLKHKLQGRTDIPLNEEGRAMARKAHDEYINVHIDKCYCSPLIRARETAELLLEGRDIPIIPDDRLSEMAFGIFEGKENSFDDKDCPINELFFSPQTYVAKEGWGESLDELFARTGSFLKEILPEVESGKDILIVGHGAMNSSIITQVRQKPVSEFWSEGIENCVMKKLI